MGIFSFFKKKRTANYEFTEEDAKRSADIRSANAELKRKRMEYDAELHRLDIERKKLEMEADIEEARQRLADLRGEDEEEDDDNDEMSLKSLLPLILTAVQGRNGNPPAVNNSNPPPMAAGVHFSDEQIADMYEQIPKLYRKMAQKMTDEQVAMEIRKRLPSMDDDSVNRSITYLRNN